jgi:hypothetical protein
LVNQVRKAGKTLPADVEVKPEVKKMEASKPVKSTSPFTSQRKLLKTLPTKPVAKKPFKFNDFFDELDKNSRKVTAPELVEIPVPKYTKIDYEKAAGDEDLTAKLKIQKDRQDALLLKNQRIALDDEHLQPYTLTKNSSSNKVQEMLKNPDDLKTAIILSEILNRKY